MKTPPSRGSRHSSATPADPGRFGFLIRTCQAERGGPLLPPFSFGARPHYEIVNMKKMLFIYNPRAGKGQIRQKLADILDLFAAGEYEITIVPTRARGDATLIVRERAGDVDIVVCCGGDGTLDETVTGLMQGGIRTPVGYIPAGSTNDYGSSLAIPRDLIEAARRIVIGEDYPVDIGTFNQDVFVYIAAFGAFTEVSYRADQNLKNVLGHSAYILEGAKSIPEIRPYHVRLRSGSFETEGNFLYGMVTNSRSVGGFKGITGEDVDLGDGEFEVLLVREPRNILETERIFNAFVTRNFEHDSILRFHARELELEFAEDVAWTLDGEDGGMHRKVRIENHRQAVTLRV